MGGTLAEHVRAARAAKVSWRDLAREVSQIADTKVTFNNLCYWFADEAEDQVAS